MIRRHPTGPALRARALVLAALLAVTAMAACGRGDTGATESSLTVYSGRSEELVGPLFAQFTEQTGIRVNARYGDSAELAAQLVEEGDRSPAQVFFAQDAGALGSVEAAGLFAPLPEAAAAAVPADYRATNGTWTGITGRARVIVYDPEQVAADQVPRRVADLTDPRWRSQVAIAPTNASFQAFVTAMRIADGDDDARKWLEGMVANDAQRYEKNGLILDAVDAGQAELGLINHYYWYEKAAEVGESKMRSRIAFTAPGDPGSLVNVAGAGILKPAGNNKAAAEFVDWLLSPDAQRWFVANTYEYPLLPNIPPAEGLPSLDSLRGPDVSLADLDSLPATLAMLENVGLL